MAVGTLTQRETVKAPDSDGLYEIVNGERREKPPMGAFAGLMASMLSQLMGIFALQRRLGFVVVKVLFNLKPGRPQRRPDIAYVSYDRCPDAPALLGEDPPAWDVVPNLVVEAVSPTNSAVEIIEKIEEYFEAGVQLVWVIYPVQRQIYVYDSPTRTQVLTEGDELDGGNVLPGFRLAVAELFAPLTKPQ